MREGGKFKNRKRKKKHGGKRGRELAGGGINRISEGEFPQTGNQAHCQIHHTHTPSSSNTTRPPPLTHISLLSAYHQNVCECVCVWGHWQDCRGIACSQNTTHRHTNMITGSVLQQFWLMESLKFKILLCPGREAGPRAGTGPQRNLIGYYINSKMQF